MLAQQPVQELLHQLQNTSDPAPKNTLLHALVTQLSQTLPNPPVTPDPLPAWQPGAQYPLDAEGYAVAFDPVTQPEEFLHHWKTYGIVVGKNVVPTPLLDAARTRMRDLLLQLSENKCDLLHPETYPHFPHDAAGTSFISRGFYELYHDAILAEIRQSPVMYLHHALIWQRADLWTSFDRLGFKPPEHADAAGLPLHVDQNPQVHPTFKTVQGVLALEDCPLKRGTFVGVPTSRALFQAYAEHTQNRGEYVELPTQGALHAQLAPHAQALPLRKGCLVSWDSRTTHANSSNLSHQPRYAMYVAAGPAREDSPDLIATRNKAFQSGEGSNVREALMHASKKPRYTSPQALAPLRQPENLTLLGQLLYSLKNYKDLAHAPAA